MTLLNVRNLHTRFGKTEVLIDINFYVKKGETYALVGESGSGKTTLIRAIAGLAPAQKGQVSFEGQELRGLSEKAFRPLRENIAMMFQDPVGSLSPRMTIGNLLTEPYRIQGMKNRDINSEAKRLLEMVNLPPDFAERYPYQLSGGQARRIGVARALALKPKLILADEPTAGLDVSVQGELLNLLNHMQKKLHFAMIIITHNLNVVRHVADRMGIMYMGRLIEEANTDSIFNTPKHPYTRCLLSANPEPDPDAQHARIKLKGEPPSLFHRPSGCEFRERCPSASQVCTKTPSWDLYHNHGVRCFTPFNTQEIPSPPKLKS